MLEKAERQASGLAGGGENNLYAVTQLREHLSALLFSVGLLFSSISAYTDRRKVCISTLMEEILTMDVRGVMLRSLLIVL